MIDVAKFGSIVFHRILRLFAAGITSISLYSPCWQNHQCQDAFWHLSFT
jgi:hypothetical protein